WHRPINPPSISRVAPPVPARATRLFEQSDLFDLHPPVRRLHHVVNREEGDRNGGERLHFHARPPDRLRGGPRPHPREPPVQRGGEPASCLKRLQAERDLVPAHRTCFHRGEEPLGGFRPPCPAGPIRKEPAYPPVRQCNSLRQLVLPTLAELSLCERCHDAVGQSCHSDTHYARQNRRKQRVRRGRRQDEHRVRRRLLQGLE